MPEFAYIARDMKGERVTGNMTAGSQREAVAMLSGKSLFPVEVNPAQAETATRFSIGFRPRPNGQLMATTYSQFASLLSAGVPLLRSIEILRDQASQPVLKEVLSEVHREVEDGATLADAMSRHRGVFSEMAVNMVRAGAEGGFMEEAFERVSSFTEKQEDLKGRTVGAIVYPMVILVVGFIVVTILIVFFVPMYAKLFDEMRQRGDLPVVTEVLLMISESIRSWTGWFVFLILFVAALCAWARLSSEEGRRTRDAIKLRMPLLGKIFQSLAVARFCRVLGTMLQNGVPILRSLDISREATGNRVLSDAIEEASENVTAGESLAAPLTESGQFPTTVVEMISVAEESNSLEKVLVNIADGLERRTFRRLELTVRLIEPLFLVVLAVVVLCVILALLLPFIKMYESM